MLSFSTELIFSYLYYSKLLDLRQWNLNIGLYQIEELINGWRCGSMKALHNANRKMNMNILKMIVDPNTLNSAILIILGFGTLIQVLDMLGFLPKKWRDHFKLNHSRDTLEVLKEYGIDPELYRRHNISVGIPQDYSQDTSEAEVKKKLNEIKIGFDVSVGKVRKTKLDYYIDLIGHSCDPECAKAYARILSSYWADKIESSRDIVDPQIDFIVTPKGGSPILGYEFAKLLNKPFLLHEESERFTCKQDDMRKWFDCAQVPDKGSRALIVDDSTTGGRMVSDTIRDLRKYGYEISECLVVFEPQHKDARQKLAQQQVKLLSICKTHEG